jgi:hypothetical protein
MVIQITVFRFAIEKTNRLAVKAREKQSLTFAVNDSKGVPTSGPQSLVTNCCGQTSRGRLFGARS